MKTRINETSTCSNQNVRACVLHDKNDSNRMTVENISFDIQLTNALTACTLTEHRIQNQQTFTNAL